MRPVVLVGVGELGGYFAQGFLRTGYRVIPVRRQDSMATVAKNNPEPEVVIVAVGEADLDDVLAEVPPVWSARVVLMQNELVPGSWQRHEIQSPTVAVVWFEKKPKQPVKELLPTAVFGPHAIPVEAALGAMGIVTTRILNYESLVHALVEKNLYILTTNIAGLEVGGTTSNLWSRHRRLALTVAREVLRIQGHLVGEALPEEKLLASLERALLADPEHQCTGRSAPGRLARALGIAQTAEIDVPELTRISELPR
ncbi:MAG: hypothetical protein KC776_24415 [Myxococcales bacterium]|nr:hypothetical protein [Myxococcales bacterium]MCB9582893.1 hypothetical protein [Polyangiaceae bacterium]